MVVAAAALVETYAVLTRLPPPHRLSAPDTIALLDANFMAGAGAAEVIALDAAAYRSLLHRAPLEGSTGRRIYDALIAACTLHGHAESLVTFNERHFRPFASPGLQIVVPHAER